MNRAEDLDAMATSCVNPAEDLEPVLSPNWRPGAHDSVWWGQAQTSVVEARKSVPARWRICTSSLRDLHWSQERCSKWLLRRKLHHCCCQHFIKIKIVLIMGGDFSVNCHWWSLLHRKIGLSSTFWRDPNSVLAVDNSCSREWFALLDGLNDGAGTATARYQRGSRASSQCSHKYAVHALPSLFSWYI